MNAVSLSLLLLAAPFALVNWAGVVREDRRLVLVGKPATLALFVAAAATLSAEDVDGTVRGWFVAGLVLSLAGDVFLMLPTEDRPARADWFLLGLVAFLLGHVAYIVGQVVDHRSWALTLVGLVAVVAAGAAIGPTIVRKVGSADRRMVLPVVLYMAVISAMVVTAFGRTVVVGIVGALLFFASDGILAWNRFVKPSPVLRIAVMVTYHLGQLGLLLSLLG